MTAARDALALWLKRLQLRSKIDPDEQEAVLSLPGRFETIQPNFDFVTQGERVDRACLVVSGLAGRFGQTRDGQRKTTAVHIAGDMADLHSVVLPTAASALQSLDEVVLYRVPHGDLKAAAVAYPALAEAFWRDCTLDAAVLSQWAVVNGRLPARGRIAHLLCELCCRFSLGTCRDGQAFDWPLTQIHVGDATGLTAVHVNRMLRELRENGAAEVRDRTVVVLDWKRLCGIGEFSSRYLDLERAE